MNKAVVIAAVISGLAASLATFVVIKTPRAPATSDAIGTVQERATPPAAGRPGLASEAIPALNGGDPTSMLVGGDELAQLRAMTAALDSRFRAQARDGAWASKTEQTLRETMTSEVMVATEIVPSRLDYSCRTDLCLVKAEFAKYGDATDWGIMLVTAAGETFVNARPMVMALPNGNTELQLYAARP